MDQQKDECKKNNCYEELRSCRCLIYDDGPCEFILLSKTVVFNTRFEVLGEGCYRRIPLRGKS